MIKQMLDKMKTLSKDEQQKVYDIIKQRRQQRKTSDTNLKKTNKFRKAGEQK